MPVLCEIKRAALDQQHLGTWGRVQVQRIISDECVRWGPPCRITNLLESNSWYQGLGGNHTPGRVGPDSHRRRLTGRLISKWDGLDHPLAHPLLRCRGPLVRRSKKYEQLFIFMPQGSSVDVSIRRGRSFWNAAACLADSWNLSTTEFTASPKRPEGERGASIRKFLSFPLILLKFNHKCLSVATRAAMDRPIDLAAYLVALRDKSVARSQLHLGLISHVLQDLSRKAFPKRFWRNGVPLKGNVCLFNTNRCLLLYILKSQESEC